AELAFAGLIGSWRDLVVRALNGDVDTNDPAGRWSTRPPVLTVRGAATTFRGEASSPGPCWSLRPGRSQSEPGPTTTPGGTVVDRRRITLLAALVVDALALATGAALANPSENGNGKGNAKGRPCAGCVGNGDAHDPKGQGNPDKNN